MGEKARRCAAVGERRARGAVKAWNEHEMLTRRGKELKGIVFNLTE